jgi:hypothetical protein
VVVWWCGEATLQHSLLANAPLLGVKKQQKKAAQHWLNFELAVSDGFREAKGRTRYPRGYQVPGPSWYCDSWLYPVYDSSYVPGYVF